MGLFKDDKSLTVILSTIEEGAVGLEMIYSTEGYNIVKVTDLMEKRLRNVFGFSKENVEEYAETLFDTLEEEDKAKYLKDFGEDLKDKCIVMSSDLRLAMELKEYAGAKINRVSLYGQLSEIPMEHEVYDRVINYSKVTTVESKLRVC